MNKQYIHKPVVFNMANPYHRKVFEWMQRETTNFSGFIFDTLAMRYEGFSKVPAPKVIEEETNIEGWL